jgi:RNAse (barnase) inhibitor barstar
MTTFTIDGGAIRDIPSLYDELNRVFMEGEDWRLGESLDALNDLLYGGFGALLDADDVVVRWTDSAASRAALGHDTTIAYYRGKLAHPETVDADRFGRLLAEAEAGRGQTYFDIVLEVFADHPEIALELL